MVKFKVVVVRFAPKGAFSFQGLKGGGGGGGGVCGICVVLLQNES